MAKLSARGRTEIWRVEKEGTGNSTLTVWEKDSVALMSDGHLMLRHQVRFKPDNYYPKGKPHDYGWKEKRKLTATEDPAKFLEKLQLAGYSLVGTPNLGAWNNDYAKALEASKRASQKRAVVTKRKKEEKKEQEKKDNGPGLYVRNRATGRAHPWATNFGPVTDLETAIENAVKILRNYLEMRFDYLLPVQVVEAASRTEAEEGSGHVWWTNGKNRGAPVHAGQMALFQAERS